MTGLFKEIGWRIGAFAMFLLVAVLFLIAPNRTLLMLHGVFDRLDRDLHAKARREAMN